MQLSDFDFTLPKELIAQEPLAKRDDSSLLVVDGANQFCKKQFSEIVDYFRAGDLIVFNNTKVIKAKLILQKGDRKIELYLNKLYDSESNSWLCFAKPAKKLKEGDDFSFGDHKIIIAKKLFMGETIVQFVLNNISVFEFLEQYGQMPLPPYIKRNEALESDLNRYQTVYSAALGSVAAPTAGLHFTKELINKLKDKDVNITYVTLHVGSGTFLPVKTENISEHKMHSEYCYIDQEAADIINATKEAGRRIIAVGTTSLRTLEGVVALEGKVRAGAFETNIFITPGFKFQIVDLLVTNFHLPKSTLFILVCAFAGYHEMHNAYQYAIEQKMRFFSYGDAMLLTNNK